MQQRAATDAEIRADIEAVIRRSSAKRGKPFDEDLILKLIDVSVMEYQFIRERLDRTPNLNLDELNRIYGIQERHDPS